MALMIVRIRPPGEPKNPTIARAVAQKPKAYKVAKILLMSLIIVSAIRFNDEIISMLCGRELIVVGIDSFHAGR